MNSGLSSFIRYKFFSANYYDTIQCDGPSMPVWELRDEIIAAKRLGRLIDCDIHLYDEQTNEEYLDENYCIPRNSMVIIKRLPKAINTSISKGSNHKNRLNEAQQFQNFHYQQKFNTSADGIDQTHKPILSTGLSSITPELLEEEARIQAMSKATSEMFTKHLDLQESLGYTTQAEKFTTRKLPQILTHQQASGRIPHPNYICYRCGSKDHYISDCTYGMIISADGKLQPMQMMKRVTGIPKTFLEQAKKNNDTIGTSTRLENKRRMISYDGSMVYFAPNTREWDKFSSLAASDVNCPVDELPLDENSNFS